MGATPVAPIEETIKSLNLRERSKTMKEPLMLILVVICFLVGESLIFPTIPNPYEEIDEEIRLLKKKCEMMYPVGSISIDPKTQNTIMKWKGGDSYGRVIEGEIYEEVGYPKYCVMSDIQIEQLMKIE